MDFQFSAGNGGERADPGHLDDSTLLAQARSGDQRALEALCRRNWRPVYRSFARYTKDPAEAEDLTQEVFLRALRATEDPEPGRLGPQEALLAELSGLGEIDWPPTRPVTGSRRASPPPRTRVRRPVRARPGRTGGAGSRRA